MLSDPALGLVVSGLQSEPSTLEEMKAERGISVDHTASKQFLRKVLKRHGRPKRIVIDVS